MKKSYRKKNNSRTGNEIIPACCKADIKDAYQFILQKQDGLQRSQKRASLQIILRRALMMAGSKLLTENSFLIRPAMER